MTTECSLLLELGAVEDQAGPGFPGLSGGSVEKRRSRSDSVALAIDLDQCAGLATDLDAE